MTSTAQFSRCRESRQTARIGRRICQGAYPTLEYAGLIFAYLGPPDRRPAFPIYDTFDVPGFALRAAARFELPCNWLQIKDNSMDPVHTAFLHALSSGEQFTAAFGQVPAMEWQETTLRDDLCGHAPGGRPRVGSRR